MNFAIQDAIYWYLFELQLQDGGIVRLHNTWLNRKSGEKFQQAGYCIVEP